MNIQVAIRVRPFNDREKKLKTKLCVQMKDNTVFLVNEKGEEERKFSYDHCFWSFDGFKKQNDGYMIPDGPSSQYADQEIVYNEIGKGLLKDAIDGFHCCLFAYGQTGSGKSYSIFGYDANKGIVPKICEELFNGGHLTQTSTDSFLISVSMYEIYNEHVNDLLVSVDQRPKHGLKIRENPKLGVFIEKIQKFVVNDYAEIEQVIAKGNENRTLAATLMNASSSRAHTIININILQKKKTSIKETQKESTIFLVDLAGSEKVKKTNARSDRLKEACSINTSLTVLGRVIHQLYKKSIGKKTTVSYRDSKLTRILQNALGGNSKTSMICAISPAKDNYDETVSTLRYADQAKQIKLKAKINETEIDKLIRELMEENKKLKLQLQTKPSSQEQIFNQTQKGENKERVNDIQNQIMEIENIIMAKSCKVDQNQVINSTYASVINLQKEKKFQKDKIPHMVNLNEDPMLSKKVYYNFEQYPTITIGRSRNQESEGLFSNIRHIILKGLNILDLHAKLCYEKEKLYLEILDPFAAQNTYVNGKYLQVEGDMLRRELKDLDRVIFGTSTTFLIRLPQNGVIDQNAVIDNREVDWEYCQTERYNYIEQEQKKQFEEKIKQQEQKIKQAEEKLTKKLVSEQEAFKERINKQKEEYERAIQTLQQQQKTEDNNKLIEEAELKNMEMVLQLEEEYQKQERDIKNEQEDLVRDFRILKKTSEVTKTIETKMIGFYHMIQEANLCATELNRRIEYKPYLPALNLMVSSESRAIPAEEVIQVKVINFEDGWCNYWSCDKFEDRFHLMKEAVDYFFDTNVINYNQSNDPFWDPKEFFLYGQCFAQLKFIVYRFNFQKKVNLMGHHNEIGFLDLKFIALDEDGDPIDEDDPENEISAPQELITNNMSCHYRIEIQNLMIFDIEKLKNKMGYLAYEVMTNNGIQEFRSQQFVIGDNTVNVFFSQFINLNQVDLDLIDYYLHNYLYIKLYVDDIESIEQQGKQKPPVVENKNFNPQKTMVSSYLEGEMLKINQSSFEYDKKGKRGSKGMYTIILLYKFV